MDVVDTVVVGAGQAGLAVSGLLSERGITHVVLERGRVGESWRSQRWDSFTLNTPNWSNRLPGADMAGETPDRFPHRDDLVAFLEHYASARDLPIREHTEVRSVERSNGEFLVDTSSGRIRASNVVACSGSMSTPRVPAMAADLDERIDSISAGTYRNADALAPGAVVVVGCGQSGCQIVEDLLAAGRTVHLCVSKVGRIPRRYRGRDILVWWRDMGFLDVAVQDLQNPAIQYAAQPQVSGTGGGHTISLQSLARDGASLLGRVERIEGHLWHLQPNLDECVQFADDRCAEFKAAIDTYIDANHHIDAGVSTVEGLYFVGFPWLSTRKSGILFGVTEDAERIVDRIAARA